MKRVAISLGIVLLVSMFAVAQGPQPPKPGPELKNLDFLVGTWTTTAETKAGPMGPAAKFTGTDHIEWMEGGFFLVAHTEQSSPQGKVKSIAMYGYDPRSKVYTYDEFNNFGEAIHATGTFEGKVWTWSADLNMGSGPVKTHFILTEVSPTSYTYKLEASQDGANWMPIMEGGGTKTGSATKK